MLNDYVIMSHSESRGYFQLIPSLFFKIIIECGSRVVLRFLIV